VFSNKSQLKEFLDKAVHQYNSTDFVKNDPISIPHKFSRKEDVEIAAFFSSVIAWGSRVSIIKSAKRLINLMDSSPFDFVMNHQDSDLLKLESFVHRTFQPVDVQTFVPCLKRLYQDEGGLERAFDHRGGMDEKISDFKRRFFIHPHLKRTEKHIADPLRGSSAKRINMFLRWMVRKDNKGVDFGLWDTISPSELYCPLDVHSGRVARKLGILSRKQNDWKAVSELTEALRKLDPADPVKYDFALFGLGAMDGFAD
jgi:uncharacterized protein (TIGR02757 family)